MESTTLDAKEMCIKLEPYNDICGKKTAETIEDVCITAEHRQGMQVKTETNDSVSVKEEHHKQNLKMELSCSKVRDENSKDASGLYADHIVKDEHVLGPEIMERPMQGNTQEKEQSEKPYYNYECEHCSFKTARKSSLGRHMSTHRESRQLNKDVFSGFINQQKSKFKQLRKKCTGNEPYRCRKCSFASDSKGGLKIHQLGHGEKKYKCDQCNYQTARKYSHVRHMNTHLKSYLCSQCSYAATSKQDLISHKTIHRKKDRKYKCDYCGYATAKRSVLICHIRIHTGEKPFDCKQCSYTTTTNSNLINHIKNHGEKLYKCGQCNFATAHKQSMKGHKVKHSGVKPYKCDLCGFATAFKTIFASHILTHSDEKIYKCSQCSYVSADRDSLRIHIKVHNGKKPYKCDQCNYATVGHTFLLDHIMTHSDESRHDGEKRYKCDECDYAAIHESSLLRHKKRHKGAKVCKTATETYPTATFGPLADKTCVKLETVPVSFEGSLDSQNKMAMKIKKEELDCATASKDNSSSNNTDSDGKLYKCSKCSYTSADKQNLRTHTMSHSKKPYKCDQCSFASVGRNSLLDHMMTHW